MSKSIKWYQGLLWALTKLAKRALRLSKFVYIELALQLVCLSFPLLDIKQLDKTDKTKFMTECIFLTKNAEQVS